MKLKTWTLTLLIAAPGAYAANDTLAKVAETGRLTLGYRESSVP